MVSPMCQYSSEDGLANDWHLVHLGSRAVGGAGLVLTEAAAVEGRGRISPQDLGIWEDAQIDMLQRIASFVRAQGAVAGVQLAHAGRKASTSRPWEGNAPVEVNQGGWRPLLAPSALPFKDGHPVPEAMSADHIRAVTKAFAQAAGRAMEAGFQLLEIHAAHGYLLHQFLSPLSNTRTDAYGGAFENRVRLLREVVAAVRAIWWERLPLFVRISATDWVEGAGWDLEQSVQLSRLLKAEGVDLVPDTLCGTNPPRHGNSDGGGGHDHLGRAGGNHPAHRAGRSCHPRARIPARSLLAPPRRRQASREDPPARAIRPRILARVPGPGDGRPGPGRTEQPEPLPWRGQSRPVAVRGPKKRPSLDGP